MNDASTLFRSGQYREALKSLRASEAHGTLVFGERLMLAELLVLRGEWDGAADIATRLLVERRASLKDTHQLHGILANCHFRKGNTDKGSEEFRIAIELAEKTNDLIEECRLRLQFFTCQIHWLGPQQADATLSLLRRKIHQVADVSLAVEFQLGLVELAAKLALTPAARRHLETARALMPRVNSRAIQTKFKHTEAALAAQEGDLLEALRLGLELDKQGDIDFSTTHLAILVGHLLVLQTRFREAEMFLSRAFADMGSAGGGREIALRDTMMLLKLTEGELDEAQKWEESILELFNEPPLKHSYFGLWFLVTRVNLFYRRGRVAEGLQVALDAIPRVEQMADRNLWTRLTLLIAEGLGSIGQQSRGAALVAEVWRRNADPGLDILAEMFRVSARLAMTENPTVAMERSSRASRIFRQFGNLAEAKRIEDPFVSQRESIEYESIDSNALARAVERITAISELGHQPPLLAEEVASLLKDTESASDVTVCALASEEASTGLGDSVRINCGSLRNKRYEVLLKAPSSASKRGTLMTIERMAENAAALAKSRQLERERAVLWSEPSSEQQLGLICSSERMSELIKTIRRVAAVNVTVLLTGETGVGKELFARALHQASARSDKVFLPFNCGTVPRDLIDSQLFGHRRGSFTGAHADSAGVIRSAAGGTLFLDEVGEMAIETQPKLLRFLEASEILPLGETKPQVVDVRIVAATNANLDQMVADGRFREDLYYRLNVIRINIPPLRERREEIPVLVEHFLDRFGRELQKPMLRVADETLEYLVLYRWPGNVRQLANEIRRMVALAEPGAVLMPAHLSDDIVASRRTMPVGQAPRGCSEVLTRIDQPLAAAVEHIERAAIQRALSITDGNLEETAKMLGLSRKGLYLKRQRLNLG
jgi:DNA-binding NtrC family response regulator